MVFVLEYLIYLMDVLSEHLLVIVQIRYFERLTISPDNRFVAGIGNYHLLYRLFDITTGLLVKRLELGTDS